MLQGEANRKEVVSQEEVDGNGTAFNEKCLAALVLCRALWAAWMAAFGKNPSNNLSPQGSGGSEENEDIFSPLQIGSASYSASAGNAKH